MALVQASAASPRSAQHGQLIYIYRHVRTNQTVYSLTRSLENKRTLAQIPFLGKQTQPRALRKDFWTPLATVFFSNPYQGLEAYRQLREFSKRHYHEWIPKEIPGRTRIEKGRALRDQKANSIADLAAVLLRQAEIATEQAQKTEEREALTKPKIQQANEELADVQKRKREQQRIMSESDESRDKFRELKRRKMKLQRDLQKPDPYDALMGNYNLLNDKRPRAKKGPGRFRGRQPRPSFTVKDIKIQWANTLDAEFAATWPKEVIHEAMKRGVPRTRHISPSPLEVGTSTREEEWEDIEDRPLTSKPLSSHENEAIASSDAVEEEEPELNWQQRLITRLKYGAR